MLKFKKYEKNIFNGIAFVFLFHKTIIMKKIISIFLVASFFLVSCSTSSKTSTANNSKDKDLIIEEESYKGNERVEKKAPADFKKVSADYSKTRAQSIKKKDIQKVE